MKIVFRWVAVAVLGCLTLVVVPGIGTTDREEKCGGYLKKCDTNGNGRITCAEARKCGMKTPITKDHPAYKCMTDRDKYGMVCE